VEETMRNNIFHCKMGEGAELEYF